MCVAIEEVDRDSRWCQDEKRALEEHCDEFRSSWNDWWAKEKKRKCDIMLLGFGWCLDRHGKESKQCQFEAEELKKFCDIEV
ncbi:unnamed protein product [Cuscuta campestris]|uniref:Uncharacterized protein n=1 Tax=Cuscuta campestris TaxID=132261 RepID=A0A484K4T5_9ASTE|nr:unnamed protein product [Cuscuta campestris]